MAFLFIFNGFSHHAGSALTENFCPFGHSMLSRKNSVPGGCTYTLVFDTFAHFGSVSTIEPEVLGVLL